MDNTNKVKGIKTGMLVFYYLTFFMPIYKAVVLGVTYKVTIRELNAGSFFSPFFLVVVTACIVTMFLKDRFLKIAYITTIVLMVLFILLLMVGREAGSTYAIAFYLQIITIGLLIFTYFVPEKTVQGYDFIVEKINQLIKKIKELISKDTDEEETPQE